MKTPQLFTVDRKYKSNPNINDIRDWLNIWATNDFRELFDSYILLVYWQKSQNSNYSYHLPLAAGTPHTASEALLMLIESAPEALVSPLEEECLYAESFDKCCEIIRILSSPKKNVFLYICLFLQELLKNTQHNRLDAAKLGKLSDKNFILNQNMMPPFHKHC